MTDIIEVNGDANTTHNNNKGRLPNVKRWLLPEHEGLRCDMLEVVLVARVAYQHMKLKDEPINQWLKACNGLWDKERGMFRNYEEPKGDKQLHYVKKEVD